MIARQAALGSVLMVSARLFTRLIDLATMILIARLLLPADFGLVAIAMSLVSIVETVLELPLNQALLRLQVIHQSNYDTAFSLSLIRSCLLGVILVLSSLPFGLLYGDHRLPALICALGISPIARGLISPKLAAYQREMSFWRDFVIELGGKSVGFSAAIGVAIWTDSYWAIAAGTIAYPIATAIWSYYLAPYRPRFTLADIGLFTDFVGWMTAAQLVSSLNWQSERLLIGKTGPMNRLGLFTTASDLSTIPVNAVFGPILRPLLAAFSLVRQDAPGLAGHYQTALSVVVTVGLPVLIGECLLAERLVRLLLGERWLASATLLRWLTLSMIPSLFALTSIPLVMAFGQTRLFFARNCVELLTKLPCMLLAVAELGVNGVAAARCISESAATLFSLRIVWRLSGIPVHRQLLGPWRSMVSVMAMAPVVILSARYWSADTGTVDRIVGVVAPAFCGMLTYGASLFSLWALAGSPPGLEAMVTHTLAGGRRWRRTA